MAVATRRPLIAAGLLIGAGLGGFVDGIVFHQILQWHNMLSARLPPVDAATIKVNMVWDGLFHAGVWLLTALGIAALWRAGSRVDASWSGRVLLGAALAGWGSFNLVEGLLDHHLLALHHVYEYTADPLPWDLAFLASGVLLVAIGAALVRSAGGARNVARAAALTPPHQPPP
jgi:uncharacterized membrane protein